MAKSLKGNKMIDPAGDLPYHHNVERIAMKKLFADVDPEEARKVVLDFFFNKFLPDDAARGEDEEAAREHMFDRLTELETVVRDLKKKMHHG